MKIWCTSQTRCTSHKNQRPSKSIHSTSIKSESKSRKSFSCLNNIMKLYHSTAHGRHVHTVGNTNVNSWKSLCMVLFGDVVRIGAKVCACDTVSAFDIVGETVSVLTAIATVKHDNTRDFSTASAEAILPCSFWFCLCHCCFAAVGKLQLMLCLEQQQLMLTLLADIIRHMMMMMDNQHHIMMVDTHKPQ